MHVAVVYYKIVDHNAIGRCNRIILEDLCDEVDFTVFAVEFDNPRPDRIRWVKIPAPLRPLFLLFLIFHVFFLFAHAWRRIMRASRFDAVQGIESTNLVPGICYSHFCHRHYLQREDHSNGRVNLRDVARWLDHKLHALIEPMVYKRAKTVVVPSVGLKRELLRSYPGLVSKITVLPNPVELARFERPSTAVCSEHRRELGLAPDSFVVVFVALGHFERKGLGRLIEAVAVANVDRIRLMVVGGSRGALTRYRDQVVEQGLEDRVSFHGLHHDVRAFLWAADCFALPSQYEVFPLVALEAAAASLPLLVTHLNGVEEFVKHGVNGFVLEDRKACSIAEGLRSLSALGRTELETMMCSAKMSVERFGRANFSSRWRTIYKVLAGKAEYAGGHGTLSSSPIDSEQEVRNESFGNPQQI